jgi:hypothetical protein
LHEDYSKNSLGNFVFFLAFDERQSQKVKTSSAGDGMNPGAVR